jgi:Fic family protein
MRSRAISSRSPALIWQRPGWPALHYAPAQVAAAIANARRAQGKMEGQLLALGFEQRQHISAEAWAQEALATAAIEGERLDLETVRSSVARRLGMAAAKDARAPRHVDGLLDVMDDAVARATDPLTHERLHAWQAGLFPSGYSGIARIRVGGYRDHAEPMQIISGPIGSETVHYEAPPSAAVPQHMAQLLAWLDGSTEPNGLVKAALAHLWFETIHPFEDGNGRVGRAIVDLILARDSGDADRVVRISAQLLASRKGYYDQLQRAQHGDLDVTPWVLWFIGQVQLALVSASQLIDLALAKSLFWHEHRAKDLNPRQRKAINVMLDAGPTGFEGGMSTRKYENLNRTARATASRDLLELAALGLLLQLGAGRSTRYQLQIKGWAVT